MKEYFQGLTSALRRKLELELTPRRLFAYESGRLGLEMAAGERPLAWTGVFIPFELFRAMDVSAFFIEFVGGMLAGTGKADRILQLAESKGFSADGCAYHRAILGAAEAGLLPRPRFVVGSTCPCDGGLKAVQSLARRFDVEFFLLQIPYGETPESVRYMADQLRDLTGFIRDKTGIGLDMDRFERVMALSNRAAAVMREAYALAQNIPSPATNKEFNNFQIVFSLLLGSEEGVRVAETYRDAFAARIETPTDEMRDEKLRLLWIQNRIQFPNELLEAMWRDFGAKLVIDELNYIYWDGSESDDPFEALALRLIRHPFNGPLKRRLDILGRMAADYTVHGAVNPSHWGCRQNLGARTLIKESLERAGVPAIHLDLDCVDPRNFALGPILTRVEGFLEMLE